MAENKRKRFYGGRKKRRCELGDGCPYKNEMQHLMEFSHGEVAQTQQGKNDNKRRQTSIEKSGLIKRKSSNTVKNMSREGKTMGSKLFQARSLEALRKARIKKFASGDNGSGKEGNSQSAKVAPPMLNNSHSTSNNKNSSQLIDLTT